MTHDLSTGLGRLKQLRDDLAALHEMKEKPVRFDMSRWKDERNLCGTSACAVGYCAMQPWAQKQGLRLVEKSNMVTPAYGYEKGFEAAASFFDLLDDEGFSDDSIYYLFDDGAYEKESDDDEPYKPTIPDVLERLDEVIARHPGAKA